MRVYLPSTLPALAAALRSGEIGSPSVCAFAVTPAFREWYASGDIEELEYAALTAAARASLRLLAADPDAPTRRVVIAAEIPDEAVEGAPGNRGRVAAGPGVPGGSGHAAGNANRATVLVKIAVPLTDVVSAHIDDPAAITDVAAAIAALAAADGGDEDARFTVDGAEGHELLWFATSELPYLLG